MACEVLSAEAIQREIGGNEDLLVEICELGRKSQGNRVLLGYISKVVRTLVLSSDQEKVLRVLYGPRNLADCLVLMTYSLSVTDLLVTLISIPKEYEAQKQSIVLQLAYQSCTGQTAEIRGNCRRAIEDIISNAQCSACVAGLYQTAVLTVALEAINSEDADKAIEGTRVLKAIISSPGLEMRLEEVKSALISTISTLKIHFENALRFRPNFELISLEISLLASICRFPSLFDSIIAADLISAATRLFQQYELASFLSVSYVKLANVLLAEPQLRAYYLSEVHIQDIILTMVLDEKLYSTKKPIKGFITQLSNMIVASDCSGNSSPKWNKYVNIILKRINGMEQIAFSVLKRPAIASGEDKDEDSMLKISGLQGIAPGYYQAQASTTLPIRAKCLKLLRKLQSMDEEVNKPVAVAQIFTPCLPYMNPVYADQISSFEAKIRVKICTEAFDRAREYPI